MSIASTEEQHALLRSVQDWARAADPVATVRGQEPGVSADQVESWQRHWPGLAGLGLFAIALPEDAGGAGGSPVDLAVALEQVAAALVPGPVLPTVLAGRLLAGCPDTALAKELLPRLADGQVTVAVALDAGTLRATDLGDGRLRVSGEVGPVLGAGDADHLLLATRKPDTDEEIWFLVQADTAGLSLAGRVAVDFSRSLADVRAEDLTVAADRVLPGVAAERVRDLAVTLAAIEAAGIAGWCLRTATEYAKVREQFGRPIGSFQAVKHLCAGMLCQVEQIVALAWDAARALDDTPEQQAISAAAAGALVLDAAVDTAKDCVQVLGGIGFTWEHDAHLYLRRALAIRQLLGGGAAWRRRAAELALAGRRRRLHIEVPGEAATADRADIRSQVAELAELPAEQRRERLADNGFLAPHWPRPYGLDAPPADQLLIDEELRAAGVDRPDLVIGGWAVPTILAHGSTAQRDRFVRPTLRGEITWCQLFSEPGAGSDLASLRTRAHRVDGGWRITGQKVWTSLATEADWAICLARTDPDAPKHKGISYFLVDMRTPGIDIRPLREITGIAAFNEVFLDDVFVPDECLVGEVDGGWKLARTTLANERVAMSGGSSLGEGLEGLLRIATERGLAEDAGVRERLGALVGEALATSLLDVRTTLRALDGREPGPESSVRKLVGVRHRQAVAEAALELSGVDGATADGPLAPIVHELLLTRCLSIAGGTTQILLTVAAERILGLPRS